MCLSSEEGGGKHEGVFKRTAGVTLVVRGQLCILTAARQGFSDLYYCGR
jgi:hypothetical protein